MSRHKHKVGDRTLIRINWQRSIDAILLPLGATVLMFASLAAWNVLYCGMPTYTGYHNITHYYSVWDFVATFLVGGFLLITGFVLLWWSSHAEGDGSEKMLAQ